MYDLLMTGSEERTDRQTMSRELRIGIDARLIPGQMGGVEQTIAGLAHGLALLDDGDESYHFLVYPGVDGWITPHLRGRCRMMHAHSAPPPPEQTNWRKRPLALVRRGWHTVAPLLGARLIPIQDSDGVIEQESIDVMHFAAPVAFRTHVRSLYHVQDVQHRVLAENFSRYEIMARDTQYQAFMHQAQVVTTSTTYGRSELLAAYPGVPPQKVVVVPFGPAPMAESALTPPRIEAIRQQLDLPAAYLFYPAQTWKHKNHIGLLHALAQLKQQAGLELPLLCSGRLNEFYPTIQRTLHELDLQRQVRFLGFVTPEEMQVLYAHCRAVIFPTLYEGFGMPVLEALQHGCPLACSNITPIGGMVKDGALLFDPTDAAAIADAIQQIWCDEPLRTTLSKNAAQRVAQFNWLHTARLFRAHYRRIAGRGLTGDDQELLAAAPLV
jgi:glycosyltransferase involved in cell wall biosynthesis